MPSPYDYESDTILDPSVTNAYCDADGCPEPVGDERFEITLGGELYIFCSPECRRRTLYDFYAVEEDDGPVGDTVPR